MSEARDELLSRVEELARECERIRTAGHRDRLQAIVDRVHGKMPPMEFPALLSIVEREWQYAAQDDDCVSECLYCGEEVLRAPSFTEDQERAAHLKHDRECSFNPLAMEAKALRTLNELLVDKLAPTKSKVTAQASKTRKKDRK